jgi:hypothetical protein
MKSNYVLALVLFAGFGATQSLAQDAKPTTVEEYAHHLEQVYGKDGVMIAGTVTGKTKGGKVIIDNFPASATGMKSLAAPVAPQSISQQEAQCDAGQVITHQTSGSFAYNWCAKLETIGGVTYEAKRDTLFFSGGRWTYVVSTRFDCQNATDLAAMPSAVKLAVCP